ncbi:hypothetical protein NFI96_027462, partial [Prochilodus magdalenae]
MQHERIMHAGYTPFCDAYKPLPRPPFGKSDHSSILLLPTYRQKLKQAQPTIREVHRWSDQSDSMLQDCFDHVDWEMFREVSNNNLDEYTDSVTGFIRKCIEDVVPTRPVRVYPNQKPWLNCEVRAALNARTAAFKSGHTEEFKNASYALRKIIRAAKREYRAKVESQFNTTNTRSLWQGLNTITYFRGETRSVDHISAALPDELNTFYARFEVILICSSLPATLDPMQFAYRQKRSTDDAIALTLHTALSHLDKKNTYVRMLFVDYSSAFNTIVPSRLDIKLRDLGLNSSLCSWILNFLTDRRQVVKLAGITSSSLSLKALEPHRVVCSALSYDTTIVGLISNNNEEAYREEVSFLTHWCRENNLSLNVNKTKELIVDFRKQERVHTPITINGAAVERVSSFKFLGVHITEELTWTEHTTRVGKKAQQRLFFLRRLKRFGMDPRILRTFYTCTVESILTGSITTWYGSCTAIERKALQRVVQAAQYITGVQLPNLLDLYTSRCLRKTRKILRTPPTQATVCSHSCQ